MFGSLDQKKKVLYSEIKGYCSILSIMCVSRGKRNNQDEIRENAYFCPHACTRSLDEKIIC